MATPDAASLLRRNVSTDGEQGGRETSEPSSPSFRWLKSNREPGQNARSTKRETPRFQPERDAELGARVERRVERRDGRGQKRRSIELRGGGYIVNKMENRWTFLACRSRSNVGQRWNYFRGRVERRSGSVTTEIIPLSPSNPTTSCFCALSHTLFLSTVDSIISVFARRGER